MIPLGVKLEQMKQILVIVALAITGAAFVMGQGQTPPIWDREGLPPGKKQTTVKKTEKTNEAEREVRNLALERDEALRQRDAATLERLLADDFTYTDSSGRVQDKAQLIASIKSTDLAIESFASDDIQVRIYGETAVLVASAMIKGRCRGQEFTEQYRHTDVWVKRSGNWQMVAAQATSVAGR